MPALREANGRGVVSLSSRASRRGIDFESPHFERRAYDKWKGVRQSKTANALFALALDSAARRIASRVASTGAVMTEFVAPADDSSRIDCHAGRPTRRRAGRRDERVVRANSSSRGWAACMRGRGVSRCRRADASDAVGVSVAIDRSSPESVDAASEAWTAVPIASRRTRDLFATQASARRVLGQPQSAGRIRADVTEELRELGARDQETSIQAMAHEELQRGRKPPRPLSASVSSSRHKVKNSTVSST